MKTKLAVLGAIFAIIFAIWTSTVSAHHTTVTCQSPGVWLIENSEDISMTFTTNQGHSGSIAGDGETTVDFSGTSLTVFGLWSNGVTNTNSGQGSCTADTTTTTSTTEPEVTTSTTTTTLPGSTTTTECEDCVPNTNVQTTTTTTPDSTTTTQSNTTIPETSSTTTVPGSSSTTDPSTTVPEVTTTSPDDPTTTLSPPGPTDPTPPSVPQGRLPATGASTLVMLLAASAIIAAGVLCFVGTQWRKADDERGQTWFGN